FNNKKLDLRFTYAHTTPMGITKKQLEVYQYICRYWEKHQIAPTQKEIKEHFGLKSFGSVQRYIKYLQEEGLMESDWNERRGLKPNPEHDLYPRSGKKVQAIPKQVQSTHEIEVPLLGNIAAGLP